MGLRPQLNDIQTALQPLQQGPGQGSNISTPAHPAVRIPATVYSQQNCRAFCMCRCHHKETLASPSWMQSLIGSLFIGSNAILRPASHPCNERRCIKRQNWLININYYFPIWLLRRAVLLSARSTPTDECMISVRTPRIVPLFSSLKLREFGNITEFRNLFSQGLASPFDEDEKSGRSFLQVCFSPFEVTLYVYTDTTVLVHYLFEAPRFMLIFVITTCRPLSS